MKIFTKLLCAAALLLTGQQAFSQTLLDDFENTRLLKYPAVQGTLTEGVDNPFSGGTNTSAKVAKFERDGSPYATIATKPKNGIFADVAAYKSGGQKLSMKFLSPGPGIQVQLVMQNSAKLNYPKGNYAGDFFATTAAAANTWETLSFDFVAGNPDVSYDTSITSTEIDQISILINPGQPSTDTYYFDDLKGPAVKAVAATGTPPVIIDNFENIRLVEYPAAQGELTEGAPNPFMTGINTSTAVAQYKRSDTDLYATIALRVKNGGKFSDVSAYPKGGQKLSMKFLSPGPGLKIQMVFQQSDKVAYPLGNYAGDFFATTTAPANTWENVVFDFTPGVSGQTFDPSVTATDVDQIAILINYNSMSGATYYFDDIMAPSVVGGVTAVRNPQNATAAFESAYPNPTAGLTRLPYSLQKSATVSLAVYDNLGRRVAQVLDTQRQPAGQFAPSLDAARLAPGLYMCRLVVDGVALSRQLSVQ